MTTESQQQITQARKELRKLFGEWWVNGKLSYLYKPEDSETVLAIILSAIERAKVMWRKGWHKCDKCSTEWFTSIDGLVECPKCQDAAQPQRSEQDGLSDSQWDSVREAERKVAQHREQKESAKAYGPIDNCVQIGGLVFEVTMSASLIACKINAALAAERQAYETKLQGAEDDAQSWHERFEESQQQLLECQRKLNEHNG